MGGEASGETVGHPDSAVGQGSSGYHPPTLALRKHHPLRAELRQLISINLDPQAGELGDHEQAFINKTKRFGGNLVNVHAGREVLDVAGNRNRCGELEIGGQADDSVPAVGDDLDIVVVRQPGDPPRLAQATVLGAVGLNDIDGPALWPVRESQVISEAGIRKGAVSEPICRHAPWPILYRNSSSCRR